MKRNLLLTTLTLLLCTFAYSQSIHHIDFEEGLVIESGADYQMDINHDGVTDFSVNGWEDELGFVPIFAVGCFASESYYADTHFGSSVLQIFEEGDEIRMDASNMYDYLDEDRGSTFKPGEGTAEGWTHDIPNYIGFAVFHPEDGTVTNGWMKVKVDTENNTLIILEYAYHDFGFAVGEGSIIAGDSGLVNVQNLDNVLSNIQVSPNPAQDFVNVAYSYTGQDVIKISIYDNLGREILKRAGNLQSNLNIETSSWTDGVYYLNFNTKNGVHTERIIVSH